jgi:hypothetical protein
MGDGNITPRFLTSAIDEGERSASRLDRFIPGERASGSHCAADWVGPRAGLAAAKSPLYSLCLHLFLYSHMDENSAVTEDRYAC